MCYLVSYGHLKSTVCLGNPFGTVNFSKLYSLKHTQLHTATMTSCIAPVACGLAVTFGIGQFNTLGQSDAFEQFRAFWQSSAAAAAVAKPLHPVLRIPYVVEGVVRVDAERLLRGGVLLGNWMNDTSKIIGGLAGKNPQIGTHSTDADLHRHGIHRRSLKAALRTSTAAPVSRLIHPRLRNSPLLIL